MGEVIVDIADTSARVCGHADERNFQQLPLERGVGKLVTLGPIRIFLIDDSTVLIADLPRCDAIAARDAGKFTCATMPRARSPFLGSVELQLGPKGSGIDPRLCNAPESVGNAAALVAIEQWALSRNQGGTVRDRRSPAGCSIWRPRWRRWDGRRHEWCEWRYRRHGRRLKSVSPGGRSPPLDELTGSVDA